MSDEQLCGWCQEGPTPGRPVTGGFHEACGRARPWVGGEDESELRERIATEISEALAPLVAPGGEYDCCGCSTYVEIMEHAVRIARLGPLSPGATR